MKRKIIIFSMIIFLLMSITTISYAQEGETLQLRISKDFGYSAGAEIQGKFSLRVSGLENLGRVEYYIDGQLLGQSMEAPNFRYKFDTDEFPNGTHTLSAIGYTTDQQILNSNQITRRFISASQGYSSTIKIVGIILGVVIAASLISFLVSRLAGGKKESDVELGSPRNYGGLGGTVCPKCGRPFSRHLWGLNLVAGKFDRCPHCGKWSLTRMASQAELRAAERAELDMIKDGGQKTATISDEERLRKELDDSRYEDL